MNKEKCLVIGGYQTLFFLRDLNEDLSRLYYSPKNLAPEFSRDNISPLRVNGGFGFNEDFDPEIWKLQIVGVNNPRSYSQYFGQYCL